MWKHGGFLYAWKDPHSPNIRQEPDKHIIRALRHVTSWSLAIDGGAHVGVVSRYLQEHFKSVIAVELAPDTAACLRKNLPNIKKKLVCKLEKYRLTNV